MESFFQIKQNMHIDQNWFFPSFLFICSFAERFLLQPAMKLSFIP